jgi:hypothetical protein
VKFVVYTLGIIALQLLVFAAGVHLIDKLYQPVKVVP